MTRKRKGTALLVSLPPYRLSGQPGGKTWGMTLCWYRLLLSSQPGLLGLAAFGLERTRWEDVGSIRDLRVGFCLKLQKVAKMILSLPPRPPDLLHYMLKSKQGAISWSPLASKRTLNSSHKRHSPHSRSSNHAFAGNLGKLEFSLCSFPDVISHCPSRAIHRTQGTGYLGEFSEDIASYNSFLSATEIGLSIRRMCQNVLGIDRLIGLFWSFWPKLIIF